MHGRRLQVGKNSQAEEDLLSGVPASAPSAEAAAYRSKPVSDPEAGGGYEQLLRECLHCRLGHGAQCKLRDSDELTCPSAVWIRDHPKGSKKRKKDDSIRQLTPLHSDWRRTPAWRDAFLGDLINLPGPQFYLFYYPGAAPSNAVFHTLRRTSPQIQYEWAHLWPLAELPAPESIFFVAPIRSTQPHKLACDPAPTRSGPFVYSTRPPFRNGVFFFARAGWLYAHYEVAADLAPQDSRPARKQRLAEDKVRTNPATIRMCLRSGTRGIGIPSGFVNKTHFKMCLTEDPWV